ncbi:MAG: hypothetical protein ACRDZR_02210 [Acidimicrobiales bacterium]
MSETEELARLRAEVTSLRAAMTDVERWRATLVDGTGTVRVRAVTVCDPRGVERVVLGCAEVHETPGVAGECCESFGLDLRTGLGRSAFDVTADDEQASVQLHGERHVAVSIGRDGIHRYGPDEQEVPARRLRIRDEDENGQYTELIERAGELVDALRTDADDLEGTLARATGGTR